MHRVVVFGIFLVVLCTSCAFAGDKHIYQHKEQVPLYVNKVGPYANPSETYEYYSLPFCAPDDLTPKHEDLGEVLEGDRLSNSNYDIRYKVDVQWQAICTKPGKKKVLSVEEVKKFQEAIDRDYYFEMYLDDMPMWGLIGEVEKRSDEKGKEHKKYFLLTHLHFSIDYNSNQIVEVQVSADPVQRTDITELKETPVEFSYSIKWSESPVRFEDRMEKYSKQSFLPQHLEVHWFSIINSCITVLLLTGFLGTILMRVLKNDFIKYSKEGDEEDDVEETGWKLIHGDVFRFPARKSLFCGLVGVGAQLFFLVLALFFLALVGVFYPYRSRGALYTASVVLYALTSGISGYVSASLYRKMDGENWVHNILLNVFLFFGPLFVCFCFLNSVAWYNHATVALPFGTIVLILCLWCLVTFPLTVLGGIAGKNTAGPFDAPVRTNKVPREIPPVPWYRSGPAQMVMAGFLPFSAIYIELYYIFTSVWGHRVYTIYSILFIVFIILLIVTSFITIALTYFQLAVEDHEWWWRSFFSGGSTGFFIYGYCFYYYYARSDMTGFLQTSFYFGYMLIICYAFFVMLGTVGFYSSLVFVRHIYRAIKSD
mmetsp:Transcript_19467/g.31871  ORF Transcript_19467/g.31871 Transcript_19467/m.31871 type:complete len:596 (-) Transcript_19467:424-2211(-)